MTRNRYLTHGLPAVAAVLFGFSLWSVLGGTGTSAMIHPPAEPPVNPYPTAVAGTGLVEPSSEVVAVAVELGGVVKPDAGLTRAIGGGRRAAIRDRRPALRGGHGGSCGGIESGRS
jgi:hypothetical protein